MMVTPFFLAAMAASQVASAGAPDPSTVMIDGHVRKPRSANVAYAFECGGSTISLAWNQQWLPLDEVPLAEAQSVRLEKLSVPTRRISRSDQAQIQSLFASFAWIEKAEVNCPRDKIEISLLGMLHDPWIDYLEERIDTSPRPTTKTIRIEAEGGIKID
jgi:hypothetical protein